MNTESSRYILSVDILEEKRQYSGRYINSSRRRCHQTRILNNILTKHQLEKSQERRISFILRNIRGYPEKEWQIAISKETIHERSKRKENDIPEISW